MIEISLIKRNKLGDPILNAAGNPIRETFEAESGYEIWKFWAQQGSNTGSRSKKRKSKQHSAVGAPKMTEKIPKKKRFDDA